MSIEVVSSENVVPLTELVLELWPDCLFNEELENYKNNIGAENERVFIVKDMDEFVAFIHLSIRNDYVEGAIELPVAYIEGIYVKPKFQQKGIARELLNVAENWAREKGIKQMASDVTLINNSSIEFHKKVGFTEIERVVCFIKDL